MVPHPLVLPPATHPHRHTQLTLKIVSHLSVWWGDEEGIAPWSFYLLSIEYDDLIPHIYRRLKQVQILLPTMWLLSALFRYSDNITKFYRKRQFMIEITTEKNVL